MELSNLHIFIDVMRQGSFTAVARERDVAPSSISRSIAALEEELGVRLLQRTTRQISPTEAGQLYLQRIEPIVEELNRASSMATDMNQQPKGTLRLTASMTFGNLVIMPLIPEFSSCYPELNIDIKLTETNLDLLTEDIDIAIRLGSLPDSSLVATRLCPVDFVICATPAYVKKHGQPNSPQELHAHNCLLFPIPGYNQGWAFRDQNDHLTHAQVQGRLAITNTTALKQCMLGDMGITLLTRWTVMKELRDGRVLDLFPEYEVSPGTFDNAVWLVYPSRHYLPLKVRVFIDYLKDKFKHGIVWV